MFITISAIFPRFLSLLVFSVLMVSQVSPAASVPPGAVPVRKIVDKALQDYVKQSGNRVIDMGSWIEGSTYRNPLTSVDPSDHDMMPIFDSQKLTKNQMATKWKRMQNFMRGRIEKGLKAANPKISKAEIDRVMKSVNIYPPDPIVTGVIDEKDAIKKFNKLGAKPNLGGAPVEGIWGKAKKPFTQAYSESAGRTYFRDPKGLVRKGFTDLDNLMTGYGKFEAKAVNELCEQFAKKARLAMLEGRGADALKNLKRLNQYLRKGKNAAGLTGFETTNPKLLEAMADADGLDIKDAETMQKWLERNQKILRQGFSQADDQLMWLKEVADLEDAEKLKFVKGMRGDKFRRFMSWAKGLHYKINQAAGAGKAAVAKVPWDKVFKAAIALGVAIELYNAASLYESDGWEAANQSLSLAVINVIPTNILGQMMIDYATEVGYDLMAAPQSCLNLISGIYEVKGRQHVGEGEQIEDLAKRCMEEECVAQAVKKHAEAASRKQLDKESYAGVKGARSIQARLLGKCLPVVLQAWKRERYQLLSKALNDKNILDRELSNTILLLESKTKSTGKEETQITVRPSFTMDRAKFFGILRKYEDDLKLLGGPKRLGHLSVGERYQWDLEVLDFRHNKWRRKKSFPGRTNYIDPRNPKVKALGRGEELKASLAKGPAYRISLTYTLVVMPAAALVGFRAPEVDEFSREFRGNYTFKAVLPLETGKWRLMVSGPDSLAAGVEGKLTAKVQGTPPWFKDPGFATKLIWELFPSAHKIGQGDVLSIEGPVDEEQKYRAVLLGTVASQPTRLAEVVKTVSPLGVAWVRITAVDRDTRKPLPRTSWRISGPGGLDIKHGGASITLDKAAPGRYQIRVSAPGHNPLKGPLTVAVGKRYDKVAPLRPMEQEKPKQQPTPKPVPPTQPQVAQEAMSPQEICSCYEKWYLKYKAKDPAKKRMKVLRPMQFDPQKNRCSGQYEYWVIPSNSKKKKFVMGARWRHTPSLSKAKSICEKKPAIKVTKPKKKTKRPCGKYTTIAARAGSFGKDQTAYTNEKAAQSQGGKDFSLALPGPGTLHITVTSSGKHQYANHVYGHARWRARVILSPNPAMGFKGGWLAGGEYYPGVKDVGSNSYSWKIKKAGSISLRLVPEMCTARNKKGRLICCSYDCGKTSIIKLPGKHEIKMEFKPACVK